MRRPDAPLSHYEQQIIKATGCTVDDVAEVEDTMRHVIFHSTLDWQTRRQFNKVAREAWAVVQALRAEKGGGGGIAS